jgi:fatty-acyl-CoA synthase
MNAAQVMNLGRLLTHTARLYPDRPALIHDAQRWTWGEMEARVAAMTAALRALGLRKGDRILVQSRNNVQMFESCWVAFRLGCVWVPTNFRLTPPEVAYLGASSGACTMIVEDVFAATPTRCARPHLHCCTSLPSASPGPASRPMKIWCKRTAGSRPRTRRWPVTTHCGSSTHPAPRAGPRPVC